MKNKIAIRAFSISLFVLRPSQDECKILLLKRKGSTQPGQWCQIAGGIEQDEAAWQTVIREAKEETGLTLENLYSADYCERFYEVDGNAITVVPVFVSYVTVDCQITLNDEHSDYCWATFAEAKNVLPFPGQQMTLEFIEKFFVQREPHPLLKMPL